MTTEQYTAEQEAIEFRFMKWLTHAERISVFKVFGLIEPNECCDSLARSTQIRLLRKMLSNAALSQQAPAEDMEQVRKDASLLKALQDNSWDLRCIDLPTPGGDDVEIGWQVIEHYMAKPCERVIGEDFCDNARAAIQDAIDSAKREG